jgi:arabinogalactan endo-1,4-beta-galactosidase
MSPRPPAPLLSCLLTAWALGGGLALMAPAPLAAVPFAKGADVSWLTEMEAGQVTFATAAGVPEDCLQVLQGVGMNSIRLRVWVNPADGWNGQADVVAKAVRATALGYRIMIDFHYSDTWADPGHQTKPAAWAADGIAALQTDVAAHTTAVLTALKDAGVTPEWVQVGNETNDGLLWEDGRASTNMAAFASLVTSGYHAVKAVFPQAKVIVHISSGDNNGLFRWVFDGLTANGAPFDVIGLSLYPSTAGWAATDTACLANMNDMVARYGKEVMVSEVGMDVSAPATAQAFLTDIIAKTRSVTGGKGLGVFYWEPECHNNWQGYTLGAFDSNGRPTAALDAFRIPGATQTITFGPLPDIAFTGASIALPATVDSGLPLTFTVVAGPATVNGSQLTLTAPGTVTVQAAQAGDSTFDAATTVSRTFTVTSSFAWWQQTQFTAPELADPTVSGPDGSASPDGLPNLLKYALGLSPRPATAAGLPSPALNPGGWTCTFNRPAGISDIGCSVEVSADLVNWTSAGVTLTLQSSAGGIDTWVATYPVAPTTPCFFRLKITTPPLAP